MFLVCPIKLKRLYQDERIIPFIGAGVSMSVEWEDKGKKTRGPSWSELVEKAVEILGFETIELARVRGTDLQILEYFKCRHLGETAKLTNWFSKLMDPPDSALYNSTIHKELAALEKCRLFYTTNFDNFIERAFKLFNRPYNVAAVEAEMGGFRKDCEIIKFHGDLDHPQRIVLTESDYEERLSLSSEMDFRLRADLLGRVILFLGYSFRDPNVSYLFRLFTKDFSNKFGSLPGERAFIVVADPSDFEYQLFKARQIEVIPVRGSNYTEDVTTLLNEMRS